MFIKVSPEAGWIRLLYELIKAYSTKSLSEKKAMSLSAIFTVKPRQEGNPFIEYPCMVYCRILEHFECKNILFYNLRSKMAQKQNSFCRTVVR